MLPLQYNVGENVMSHFRMEFDFIARRKIIEL